jgi:NAD(P)-dependent dehydrogenase (short-subunit alcohol dehydrogenase family)
MRLEGKLAIVTGASRGIGAAVATAFAREGARVVLTARKAEGVGKVADAINAERPGAAFPRASHAGNLADVRALVASVVDELGVPDILVNNAATNPHFGPMLTIDDGAWAKTFEVNLRGPFEMTREVARRLMAAKKPGSVINVASIQGLRASPAQGVYGMTKAALVSMTQTLAVELGPAGIRFNAIAPGLVETRLAAAITGTPDLAKMYTSRAALGRHGKPEEIAGMVTYLASDEASFVTGQTFVIDGGYTVA